MITRRNILRGIGGALIGAPFIVSSGILMPVKKIAVGIDDIYIVPSGSDVRLKSAILFQGDGLVARIEFDDEMVFTEDQTIVVDWCAKQPTIRVSHGTT